MPLDQLCQPIELILADVDGVLTDGGIIVDNEGIETKRFHVRDGMGIRLWQKAGYRFGLITSRSSNLVKIRMAELGVEIVRQGSDDKLATAREIIAGLKLQPRQVCYIGDDLPDVRVLQHAGLGVAVADACLEARRAALWTTTVPGGGGAVRETIEMILKAQRRWDDLIAMYL